MKKTLIYCLNYLCGITTYNVRFIYDFCIDQNKCSAELKFPLELTNCDK